MKRLLAMALSLGLVAALAVPAIAAGPVSGAMGTILFDDEGGVPHMAKFKVFETDPATGYFKWYRLDGSGWYQRIEPYQVYVNENGVNAGFAGFVTEASDPAEVGEAWVILMADDGTPAKKGDGLWWFPVGDESSEEGVGAWSGGNLRVFYVGE